MEGLAGLLGSLWMASVVVVVVVVVVVAAAAAAVVVAPASHLGGVT